MIRNKEVYFPGDFNPPTKLHFNALSWLTNKPEVSSVHIIIGKSNDINSIPTDIRKDIWQQYLNVFRNNKASIIVSDQYSPLTYLYKFHEQNNLNEFTIAIGYKEAKNESFKKYFDIFPNYNIELLPDYLNNECEEMIESVRNNNFLEFTTHLPNILPLESKKLCFELIKENLPSVKSDDDTIDPVGDPKNISEQLLKYIK